MNTLLDPSGADTRVYAAHGGVSQAWAAKLLSLGVPASRPVKLDRETGSVVATLGDVASGSPGSAHESFHFDLNDVVLSDNRIPPYGMTHDAAVTRNVPPVPATQYGNPGPGGVYQHWDEVSLHPPVGAANATIRLLYQTTSWEYVQFLLLANTAQVPFLANQGADLFDAWLATGMSTPLEMASATWQPALPACSDGLDNDGDGLLDFPADPGCNVAAKSPENPQCNDGLDNDGDGLADLADPNCSGVSANPRETACGLLGVEALLPLVL